eukprot:g6180.t1
MLFLTYFLLTDENALALPTRSRTKSNNFLRSENRVDGDSDVNAGTGQEAGWCHADLLKELKRQKESLDKFFGHKVLSDATTESFNFQHDFSQYSCQFSRIVEKLLGRRKGDVIVGTGGGSATAGGGRIGESKAWPHYLEPFLNKLNAIVKNEDKKFKNNKIKFYNAAHGATNSVYNGLLQSSLYPSPTPSKRYLSSFLMTSGNDDYVPPIDMILGEFRINDYNDSAITNKYPEFMFEFWLRRSLKINNAGNVFPVVGLVDIWDDQHGKSTVEDAWRKTTGKKFEAMFPIGDIFSVSLSHYIRSSGNDKEHYRALYPSDVVNGHKIPKWDKHINIPAHHILAQLLSQKISDIMLRVCSNNYNHKCNDEEALYTRYTSMLNKLKIPSSEDVEGKSLPLLRKYNIFEKLVTSDQIVSTVSKSWEPKYGSTNDIVMCHAKKSTESNVWKCNVDADKEHLLDGTKTVQGRHDKFIAMDSPLCNSGDRIMIQFKAMSFNVFSLFTPNSLRNVQFRKDFTTFQWYEYKKDGVIDTTADKDVTKDIDKIDTSNNVLALKEYRHFFQYLFVNKKSMSSNENSVQKNYRTPGKGKALNLLICTDLKELPSNKKDVLQISGALAL